MAKGLLDAGLTLPQLFLVVGLMNAAVVANHVSFVDALVILAASPRPIRFVMDHRIFRIPILSLKGLWGSYFSRRGGAAMTKPFRRGVWSRIGLEAAAPLAPAAATPEALQEAVLALRGDWR
jgi:hypothetical protein